MFLISATFLVFYAALLVIHSIALMFRLGLTNAGTVLAASLTLGFFLWAGRRIYQMGYRQLLVILLVMLFVAVASGVIAGYFLDLSWDGRDYHQRAIRQLASGWNPLYETIQPEDVYRNAWLNHYPKGPWISSASVYALTQDIEYGKVFNLLLIWAVFFTGSAYFLTYPQLRRWQSILLALFLALNPVSMYQYLSFYADGQVSSTLILILLLLLLSLRRDDLAVRLALVATIIVALNIKFTGTAYVGLALVAFFPLSWFLKRNIRGLLPLWTAIAVGVLVGGLVVGYNPYVSNLLQHRNPFFPILSTNKFNMRFVLRGQAPPNFMKLNRVEKLFMSVFTYSNNIVGKRAGHLKNPFTVRETEIRPFSGTDVRVGGWGPLFGALVILSGVALLLLLIVSRRAALVAALLIGAILALTLINSDAWWARYAPQLWLIPVVALAALWIVNNRWLTLYGILMAVVIAANILIVSVGYTAYNLKENAYTRSTMNRLLQESGEILVYYGPLVSTGMRLWESGIAHTRVYSIEELPCPVRLELGVYYSLVDCVQPQP